MIVMDIGNSDTVIGIYKKKKLYKTYRIETKKLNGMNFYNLLKMKHQMKTKIISAIYLI